MVAEEPTESKLRPPLPEPALGPPLRYGSTTSAGVAFGYGVAGALLLGLVAGALYFYFAEYRKTRKAESDALAFSDGVASTGDEKAVFGRRQARGPTPFAN